MTKSDFVLLAEMLKVTKPSLEDGDSFEQWRKMRDSIMRMCQMVNPRFNRETFLEAVNRLD